MFHGHGLVQWYFLIVPSTLLGHANSQRYCETIATIIEKEEEQRETYGCDDNNKQGERIVTIIVTPSNQ